MTFAHTEKGKTMSKYIKLDDAIDAVMNTEAVFADVTAEPYQKTRDVTQALHNLPTIEVSEENDFKFYYVESIDDYWIGKRSDNFYYAEWRGDYFVWTHSRYLPWGEHIVDENTLWKEHTYPSEPIEISFSEWIVGFMKKHGSKVSEDCISSEIWKPIPNFEGLYEASNIGRIRSVERKVSSGKGERTVSSKILKPILDEWGYEKVSLSKGGKCVSRKVNRLVAQAFIPNPNNYPQVNHKDGIKTHNYIENLEWCTASQNMKHCFENGMSDWRTKVKIIETGQVFNSLSECARAIGGHINNIQMCLKGRRKTHKGYHFEIVGDRASDKHGRNNYKENKQEYDSKVKIEHNGEVHSLREWSEILGIKLSTLTNRYYRGDKGERLFRTVIEREDAPSVVPSCQKNRQVERAEGEWIIDVPPSTSHGTIYTCPFCGHEEEFEPTNYCPVCGEKMKG